VTHRTRGSHGPRGPPPIRRHVSHGPSTAAHALYAGKPPSRPRTMTPIAGSACDLGFVRSVIGRVWRRSVRLMVGARVLCVRIAYLKRSLGSAYPGVSGCQLFGLSILGRYQACMLSTTE
jgi:hypothetical protein